MSTCAMKVEIHVVDPGAKALSAMDEYELAEIGRKTYRFVRQCMRDPELRARIKARAAEIRENGEYT